MIYQSTLTLKKYATAGALALGLTLTAISSAWAGLLEDVRVTEVPSTNAFNSAWDAAKGVRGISPRSHIAGCVGESIVFPTGSAWNLCVKAVTKYGLIISHASFRKSAASPFITVLFDGRLGELFVPYHPGTPRFGDIGGKGGKRKLPSVAVKRGPLPGSAGSYRRQPNMQGDPRFRNSRYE
jgi:hypothetical protein